MTWVWGSGPGATSSKAVLSLPGGGDPCSEFTDPGNEQASVEVGLCCTCDFGTTC